jgi:ABC-type antimicrobial peptide transport system permease subunit
MREVSLPLPRSSVDKPTTYRRAIARGVWRLLKEKPLGACGGAIVIVLLLSALLAPWIAPYNSMKRMSVSA